MLYKYIAAVILLLMNIASSEAQQRVIGLEEVWEKTTSNYPLVKARQSAILEKEAAGKLVKLQSYPDMNVQAQQTYGSYPSTAGSFFTLPGIYNSTVAPVGAGTNPRGSNLFASGVLQWDILQFGRLKKQLDLAEADLDISRAELPEEIARLQALGSRYYIEGLYRGSLLSIYTRESERLEALFELLKSRADAGFHPGADTLLIKSAFLQARSRIIDHRALRTAATSQLTAMMNESNPEILLDSSLFFRINENFSLPDAEIFNHPYLKRLNTMIAYSYSKLSLVKKEPLPTLSLFAGTGIRGSGIDASGNIHKDISAPWNNSSAGYLAGIGLSWNLSSLYENRTRRKQVEQHIKAEEAEYDHAIIQLTTSLSTAVNNWKQQQLKIRDARLAFESSRSAFELYAVRYESGLINLIELLQIQKNLQEAETTYVESVHSLWNELLNLTESLGSPSLLLTAIRK